MATACGVLAVNWPEATRSRTARMISEAFRSASSSLGTIVILIDRMGITALRLWRNRRAWEDVPSSVELRWRPGVAQAATSLSSRWGVTVAT